MTFTSCVYFLYYYIIIFIYNKTIYKYKIYIKQAAFGYTMNIIGSILGEFN